MSMIQTYQVCRRMVVLAALLISLSIFGSLKIEPSYAHDPIFIDSTQLDAATGPFLPDGTISFALYGTLEKAFDSRGSSCKLRSGDRLVLSLLIPNQAPGKLLPLEQLPTLRIDRPDNSTIKITPDRTEVFNEPYTRMSYLRLLSIQEQAVDGIYSITVKANHRSRFTVSIGTLEKFRTPAYNVFNRASSYVRISEWYYHHPWQEGDSLSQNTPGRNGFGSKSVLIVSIAGLVMGLSIILVRIRITR